MPLKKKQTHKSDEVFFDSKFRDFFPEEPLSFIYNWAALTFDPGKLNVCPYTSADGDKRILLEETEDAEAKLEEFCAVPHKAVPCKAKKKAKERLETMVRFLQNDFAIKVSGETLGKKVNSIIKTIFEQEEKR